MEPKARASGGTANGRPRPRNTAGGTLTQLLQELREKETRYGGRDAVLSIEDENPPLTARCLQLSPLATQARLPKEVPQPTPSDGGTTTDLTPRLPHAQLAVSPTHGSLNDLRFSKAVWKYEPKKRLGSATRAVLPHDGEDSGRGSPTASTLSQVPKLLMLLVFSFVPPAELAVASLTARGWFASIDPWLFLQHHGWIPLAPLSLAPRMCVHVAPEDGNVLRDLLGAAVQCGRVSMEFPITAPSRRAAPTSQPAPFTLSSLPSGAVPTCMPSLRDVCFTRPTVQDLGRLLGCVAGPNVATVTITHLSIGSDAGGGDWVQLASLCRKAFPKLDTLRLVHCSVPQAATGLGAVPHIGRRPLTVAVQRSAVTAAAVAGGAQRPSQLLGRVHRNTTFVVMARAVAEARSNAMPHATPHATPHAVPYATPTRSVGPLRGVQRRSPPASLPSLGLAEGMPAPTDLVADVVGLPLGVVDGAGDKPADDAAPRCVACLLCSCRHCAVHGWPSQGRPQTEAL